MRFHCSVCQELFVDSDVMVAPQCGHVFHNDCIAQWIATAKKSCPTCRRATTVERLLRIFLDAAPASTGRQPIDAADLQQKIDDQALRLNTANSELNTLREERVQLKKKSNRYCKEKKEAEEKVRDCEIVIANLQQRLDFLNRQMINVNELKEDLSRCKNQLKTMETVQQIVNSTEDEVREMLEQYGDHSETARSLSTQCVILSRELNNKAASKQKVDEDLRKSRRQVSALTVEMQRLRKDAKEKEEQAASLEEEVRRYVEDHGKLHEKIRKLQESMASPSGDPRSSALQRLLHESPAPRLSSLAGLADSPDVSRTPPAPSLAAKKAARSGAVPAASFGPRLTDPGRDPLGPSSSSSSSSSSSTQLLRSQRSPLKSQTSQKFPLTQPSPKKPLDPQELRFKRMKFDAAASASSASASGLFYDGMGGHSKADLFPNPSAPARVSSSTTSSSSSSLASGMLKRSTLKIKSKGKTQTVTLDDFHFSR